MCFDIVAELRSKQFQETNPDFPMVYLLDDENSEDYLKFILDSHIETLCENFSDTEQAIETIDSLINAAFSENPTQHTSRFYKLSLEKGNSIWHLFQCLIEDQRITYNSRGQNDSA